MFTTQLNVTFEAMTYQKIFTFFLTGFLFLGTTQFAFAQNQQPFDIWLEELRAEALEKGIRPDILDSALNGLEPIERVVSLDRNQPEYKLDLEKYLSRVVSQSRIEKGKKMLVENRDILSRIEKDFGVQSRFVVALWGIETDFGNNTGKFSVIRALATLAWDPRRSKFFRSELLAALRILNEGHISNEKMLGSWAGAMGQTQFLPSVFLRSAIDYDGDGLKNIWTSREDALASAANHLSNLGWLGDQTWGRAISLPEGFDLALASLKISKPIGEWQSLGVRKHNGDDLPLRQLQSSIVLPEESPDPAYLVYKNYRVTLRWNRSTLFALAVGTLADQIGGG